MIAWRACCGSLSEWPRLQLGVLESDPRAPTNHEFFAQPYAFQSRDFLRRLVVGKVIQFQVLYTVTPAGSKTLEFGRVILSPTGPYLPELAVEQGWVKVRENAGSNENSEEVTAILEKLKALEAKARANGNGLWASSLEVVETAYDLADSEAFAERWKGQNLDGKREKGTMVLQVVGLICF